MVLALFRQRGAAWPLVTRETFYREVIESDKPVFVELWKEGADYSVFERAVQDVARAHRGDFKLGRIRVSDFADLIEAYKASKGYSAYDFDRLPALALFRKGQLVTTFNPILPLGEESVQYHDIRYQFQRFLSKFVYYDPAKVTFNHKKPDSPEGAKQPAQPAGAGAAGGPTGVGGEGVSDREARIAAAKAAAAAKLAARQAAAQQNQQIAEPGAQTKSDPDREARIAAAKAAAQAKLAARQKEQQGQAEGETGPGTAGQKPGE